MTLACATIRDTTASMSDGPPPFIKATNNDLPFRVIAVSIIAFWVGWIILMSLRAFLLQFDEPVDLLLRRIVAALGGGVITFCFWAVLRQVRSARPVLITLAAVAGAVPMTVVFAIWNWFLFYGWNPPDSIAADIARWGYERVFRYGVIDTSISWFFFFAGWGLFYVFLRAAARSASAERATADAKMQALRYQINPHFLFNALNALAGLVQTAKLAEADRMILDLSELLRRMLGDPHTAAEIPLAQEIEHQALYLALEARRFEDRMQVEFAIADDLANCPVLRLILSPLVENAVKHAVGSSLDPVIIRIAAEADEAELTLYVEDNGHGAKAGATGFQIGLANVRDRLAAHYGDSARLTAGPRATGGFVAKIVVPRG